MVNLNPVYAAIAGDIAGSRYEANYPVRIDDYSELIEKGHFTDDTVLTIAVADAIVHDTTMDDAFVKWAKKYPHAGYSKNFKEKIIYPDTPEFNTPSSSNGAVMMLSPLLCVDKDSLIDDAVDVTHRCVIARAIARRYVYAAKGLEEPEEIGTYNDFLHEEMFDLSAHGTVARAIACTGKDWAVSEVIEQAILLGGDTDTTACVAAAYQARRYPGTFDLNVDNIKLKLTGEMVQVLDELERE